MMKLADPRSLFFDFAEEVISGINGVTAVQRHARDFALVIMCDEREHVLFLENTFQETRELGPAAREARLVYVFEGAARVRRADGWEEAAPHLVPVLRGGAMFAFTPADCVGQRFAPFLCEYLALDSDGSMSYVSESTLRAWGVSRDEAFAHARATLAAHDAIHGVEPYDAAASYPIWHVAYDDSYQSSRLLLPGWLASFAGRVAGRPIAIVPDRNRVIVSGDEDIATVRRLLETAEREFSASARSLSPAVYTVDDTGRVVPYLGDASHPLARPLKIAELKLGIYEYGIQTNALKETYDAQNIDLFVGSFFGIESPSRGPISYTTWAEGAESLLPVTDFVAIQIDGATAFAPWKSIERHAAHCLRAEPTLEPPRMRTLGWPSREALLAIRDESDAL
jgi:hypothetical protein